MRWWYSISATITSLDAILTILSVHIWVYFLCANNLHTHIYIHKHVLTWPVTDKLTSYVTKKHTHIYIIIYINTAVFFCFVCICIHTYRLESWFQMALLLLTPAPVRRHPLVGTRPVFQHLIGRDGTSHGFHLIFQQNQMGAAQDP